MKRPMLVAGIVLTIAFAFIVSIPETAVVILASGVSVLFLCFFKKIRKNALIPTIGICLILSVIVAFSVFKNKIEPCIPYHNTTCSIQGKVISIDKGNDYTDSRIIIKTTDINGKDIRLNIEMSVSEDKLTNIELYDIVFFSEADLSIPLDDKADYDFTSIADGTLLTGAADTITYIDDAERTPYYYCLKLKETITQRISLSMSDKNGSLLQGMLFGGTDDLPYETAKAFRNSGIAHLLAVSGLHVTLWCGILLSILRAFRLKERTTSIVCILFLCGFMVLSSFTPSVIRASVMMMSILLAPLFNRRGDTFNTLGLAVTVILVSNPYNILSISFQLSVAATVGVVYSLNAQEKIHSATSFILLYPLRRFANGILSTICVSLFASVFTFPISAYHFGVFNIFSPLGNILCVTLAFYGMILGITGVAVSFIPTTITRSLSFALISVTEFILDTITALSSFVADIKFATVPVHKQYLLAGLFICTIVFAIGYAIYKKKFQNKYCQGVIVILSLITLTITTLIPLTLKPHCTTLTVVSAGDNLHIILRSGTEYAYITCATETSSDVFDYLPKATCEALRYYIPVNLSDKAMYNMKTIPKQYSPEEVRISDYMYQNCLGKDITLPKNTILKLQDKYTLCNEITFEIIDTYPIKYAIIKSNVKTVFVHLSGNLDTASISYMRDCDILVANSVVPEVIPRGIDTVIISAAASVTTNPDIKYIEKNCNNLLITARSGDIQLPL